MVKLRLEISVVQLVEQLDEFTLNELEMLRRGIDNKLIELRYLLDEIEDEEK